MNSLLVVFSLLVWGSCGLIIPVRFRSTPTQGLDAPQAFGRNTWGYIVRSYPGYSDDMASAICLAAGYTGCRHYEMYWEPFDWVHGYQVTTPELVNNTLDVIAFKFDSYLNFLTSGNTFIWVNRTGASIVEPPWASYNSPFHGIDAPSLALVNNTLSLTVVIASLPDTVTTLTLAAEGQPLEHELTTVIGGTAPKASPFWNSTDENYTEWYMLRYATISVPWNIVSSSNASIGAPMLITQESTFTNFRFILTASSTNERFGSASSTNLLPFVVKMPRVATATLTFSLDHPLDNTTNFWVTFTTGNTRQDVSNGTATVEFWTTVPLPYYLNSSTIKAVSPTGTAVSVQLVSGTSCSTSPCTQQWVFSFADVCNLHLVMAVSFEIACVSPESCNVGGQSTDTTVILDFVGGNECNPVVVIPSTTLAIELHKGTVDSPPITTIANGDQAILKITGTSTGAALTNVQVDSIVYWNNVGGVVSPQVTLMVDGVCSSPKCTNAITTKSVGADSAEISFVANCGTGSLVLFEQGIDSVAQWTFQVGVVFTYEGQQKRSYLTASTVDNNNIEVFSFTIDTSNDDDIAGASSFNVGLITTTLAAVALFF